MEKEGRMKRFRVWLVCKFLPNWAKESLLEENKRLTRRVHDLEREVEVLRAYSEGLRYAARRIQIKNEVRK